MRMLKRNCREFVIALFLLGSYNTVRATSPLKKDSRQQENPEIKKRPNRGISLAESIEMTQKSFRDPEVAKVRRQYWKDTLDDIKKLANGRSDLSDSSFLNQWKAWTASPSATAATSNATAITSPHTSDAAAATATGEQQPQRKQQPRPRRFEGFPSWERMLEDWSQEIQDYLDQASEESEKGYLMSDYGRAPVIKEESGKPKDAADGAVDHTKQSSAVDTAMLGKELSIPHKTPPKPPAKTKWATKQRLPMPIPAPAKPGEAVLPHTDIADLSKRLLIVTTASLPWRTGTAVNPLLRAAYLTEGRKPAGGSVTLMLPWLERVEDQHRVYGASNTFRSPEEQAEYIRTWLRESAGMAQASEDLIIQWYTAWQNPAENSVYSMGDITALIPTDDVDICILEEPEHLNW